MSVADAQGSASLDDPKFEERAENLSREDFDQWTRVSSFEEKVVRQLTNLSPKLLVGPRGCGKSTLLLLAQERLNSRGRMSSVYVNYGKSMFIEPALNARPDANEFFREWLTARILMECSNSTSLDGRDIDEWAQTATRFVHEAERNPRAETVGLPGPAQLGGMLEGWASAAKRQGVVLLLDDAAQVFVPEQQKLFFEFLQSIKSSSVSYKAAIYPGVTEYSPTYNIGHDAKTIDAWIAGSSDYLDLMHDLLAKRLGDTLPTGLTSELVDLFAVASFGIPRAFLGMVERFVYDIPDAGRYTNSAVTIVNEHANQVELLYAQLAIKVPTYKNYIEAGNSVQERITSELRSLNQQRQQHDPESPRAIEVAVKMPVSQRLNQVLALMEYAGLVRRTGETVSYGQVAYSRVAVHSAILMTRHSLAYGQNPSLARRAHLASHRIRQFSSKRLPESRLLPETLAAKCVMQLGACEKCGQPRPSPSARFCFNCGRELRDESRFLRLIQASVDELPLTSNKLAAIKAQGFRTVEDVLNDRGQVGLRKAKRVGPVWSRRIHAFAEEYVTL